MAPGIIAAMITEARILIPAGRIATGELIRLPGSLLWVSGIGPDRARRAARSLLDAGAAALVSWGSAGALHPRLRCGDLVLPEKIIASDHAVFPSDPVWHARLQTRLNPRISLHTDPLIESPAVVATGPRKSALFHETGAVAVDMESAAIARVAAEAGVPFLAIRVISDEVHRDIPRVVIRSADEFGRVRLSGLIASLCRHPGECLALMKLAGSFGAVRRTLKEVMRCTGDEFAFSRDEGNPSAEEKPEKRGKSG